MRTESTWLTLAPTIFGNKDYSETFWFKDVMAKGVYVSDVFPGYRKVPHFVIAVLRTNGDTTWILRATIYQEFLSSLVEPAGLGQTRRGLLGKSRRDLSDQPKVQRRDYGKGADSRGVIHRAKWHIWH